MKNKKNLLLIAILILLVFLVTGCSGLFTEPPKGIISGRVLIPPDAKELSKDISGWVPAAGAEVTIVDASGVTHTVVTDENGYFSFENIAVKANTIVTAQVKVGGKTIILKAIIDKAVDKDQIYDVGTLTPETTALALMVERLVKDGKEVDLEKIKKAKSFDNLANEINDVLEEHGNVTDDEDVKDLTDKIMEELFPEGEGEGEEPPVPSVDPISIATNPADVSGLQNNAEVTVTLSTTTAGTTIYYTLDGTNPTPSSTKYTAPFEVKTTNPAGETIVVKAIGVKSGYKNSTVATKEIVFKAKTYTVTFDSNGGSYVAPITNVKLGSTITAPSAPTKTGHDFVGWFKDNGTFLEAWDFATDAVTANITLYAKWDATAVNVTVTFNPNGGAVAPTSRTVTVDSVYGELPTPTRVGTGIGYRFDGWYTQQTGGTLVTADTTVNTSSNHTLYARWSIGLILTKPTSTTNIVQNSVGSWGTFGVTINSTQVDSWVQHGTLFDIRVINFPMNLTSLTFTCESYQSSNQLRVSGMRASGRSVSGTLIVEVRLNYEPCVVASFIVTVSGRDGGIGVTCNISIP